MTLADLKTFIIAELEDPLGKREAAATARLMLEDVLGVTPTMAVMNADRVIEPETEALFRRMISRIAAGEPPQYVVGKARFMGMEFIVNPSTLIPRPETAELVDLVVDSCAGRKDLTVLDVGTGSGCIAVALARALPFAQVTGIDISPEALDVARRNAETLKTRIDFFCEDILAPHSIGQRSFDVIVSNPPYIAESERVDMEPRVVDYEPSGALFVPDDDPLKFYRAICAVAGRAALFFEINPRFASHLQKFLAERGYESEIRPDSFGKKRFIIAKKDS